MSATEQAPALPAGRPGARLAALGARAATLGALAALVLAGFAIAAGAAAGTRFLHGSPHSFPPWVAGPLAALDPRPLDPEAYAVLLAVMAAAYGIALALRRRIGARTAWTAVVLAHLLLALAPPIVTPDVFSYLAYARLGALHGLSPYLHPPAAAPDPVLAFVTFRDLPAPYGPLFTLSTYPLAGLDLPAALWTLKGLIAVASLAAVALVAAIARRRGRDPVAATLFVGLNPLLLVYGVGGAHNDFLTVLLLLAGIALAARGREAAAAAAVVGGAAVKLTGGLVLPFLVAGARRRRAALAGTLGALAVAGAVWMLAFGAAAPTGFLGALEQQEAKVSELSVPYLVGWAAGQGGATPAARLLAGLVFLAVAAWLLARTARGHDWVDAAGWATLAVLLTTAWPMPYYVVWLLPLAALGSRRLAGATLLLCLAVLVSRAVLVLA
jgi:hypothetical protein